MNHKSHIRFVNSHPECNRSYDNVSFFHQEFILIRYSYFLIESGMIRKCIHSVYLQKLGYGLFRREIQAADIEELLRRAPEFQARLDQYSQPGNQQLFDALDGLLANIEAGDRQLP